MLYDEYQLNRVVRYCRGIYWELYITWVLYMLCFQSFVTQLQNDWLGHWVSLLIGHYAEPDLEERVVSFVDQLLEEFTEGRDISL